MSAAADDAPAHGSDSGPSAAMAPGLDARHLVRRVIQIALVALVIVAAVSVLPGLGDVRERFAGARSAWLVAALVLETARSWLSSPPSAACSVPIWPGG